MYINVFVKDNYVFFSVNLHKNGFCVFAIVVTLIYDS